MPYVVRTFRKMVFATLEITGNGEDLNVRVHHDNPS